MAREKRKKMSERRAHGIKEKEKEKKRERKLSKLNIKLHFAIGSSRRKYEDPTRRNSAIVTKRVSSKESYFSSIKLFAVRKIISNITYYSQQKYCSATCCFKMEKILMTTFETLQKAKRRIILRLIKRT